EGGRGTGGGPAPDPRQPARRIRSRRPRRTEARAMAHDAARFLVAIARDGEIRWDGERIDREAYESRLAQVAGAGGTIVYHREAPDHEPSREQLALFKRIVDHRIPVRFKNLDLAGSARGALGWFEMQECPLAFRFAAVPGQPLLFACRPEGQSKLM